MNSRQAWDSCDWSSTSSMSSAPSSAWESSASSSSWPTSISSYSTYSRYPEVQQCQEEADRQISHWSETEDEDEVEDEDEWETASIVTDEIELETAEQLFLSFMASMAELLKPESQTRPLTYSHPPKRSPTPRTQVDKSCTSPPRSLPHSVSMPLPSTAPWHATGACAKQGDEDEFSATLARMGDWQTRHAASVAAAVYRRHANLTSISEDPECEKWVAERGRRRQAVVGTLPLGLGLGSPEPSVQISVVGKGIAHCAEKPGLLGRLRKSWRR